MLDLQELLDERISCVHHEKILGLFQRFLAKSHCDENLLFIKATNGFVREDGNEPGFREWSEVYHRYIKEESPKECNFPESIRNGFDVSYGERVVPSRESIRQARLHIVSLLQDAYSKFQRQEELRDCVRELEVQCQCECLCEEMELPLQLPGQLGRRFRRRTGSLSFADIVDGGYSDADSDSDSDSNSNSGAISDGSVSLSLNQGQGLSRGLSRANASFGRSISVNTNDIDLRNITTPPSGHRTGLTQENIDLVSPMLAKFGDFAIDDDDEQEHDDFPGVQSLEEEEDEDEDQGQGQGGRHAGIVRALTSDDCNSETKAATHNSDKTSSVGSTTSSRSSLSHREHQQQNLLDRVRKARTMSTPPLLQSSSLRARSPPAVPSGPPGGLPAVSTSAPKASTSARSPLDKERQPQTPKEDSLPHRIKKLHRYSVSSSSKTPNTSSSSSLSSHSPTVNSQKLSKFVHRLKFGRRSSSSGDTSGPQSWQS